MAKKDYDWSGGAKLDDHSRSKHKILREYFRQYLITRCKLPQQERFRLAVIDGFCGAGIYNCGSFGSPLIFLDVLNQTSTEINIRRSADGMRPIQIECYLLFNDADGGAIEDLKQNSAGLIGEIRENNPNLFIQIEYFSDKFDLIYPNIKTALMAGRYRNVVFNLDQCGYSKVDIDVVREIMSNWRSAEAFLTFSIDTIKTYFSRERSKNSVLKKYPELTDEIYTALNDGEEIISKNEWLGLIEKLVFHKLQGCAPFVSPFSINNPKGWRYWLLHFANRAPARRVYNDILHTNSTCQAHFGHSGLNMLAFDPREEGKLYLFDNSSRETAKRELNEDIPRLIDLHGDTLKISDFNLEIYNGTPAHSDDILDVLISNPDLEVITNLGNPRRKANTIREDDFVRLNKQRSMFPIFKRK